MSRQIEILLVEDSPADVRIAEEALVDAGINVNLHVVCDGVEAVKYITHQAPYADCQAPDVVLLDLNMPRMNGHEVLEEIRNHNNMRDVPIVLLTASENSHDVEEAQRLGMNYYLRKPVEARCLGELLSVVQTLWH
jgi:two-component system, chemotaxis family, response regulator Rcp1